MNGYRTFFASFLVFFLTTGLTTPALAVSDAGEETRFFVQTGKGLAGKALRKVFGVRHEFLTGFTTDGSGLLTGASKIMGVEIIPVQRLNILQEAPSSAGPAESAEPAVRGGTPGKQTLEPSPRPTPTVRIPWGTTMLYDGTEATPSGGSDVTVAVLDTGYRPHPDLDQRVVDCKDFSQRKASVVEDTCEDTNGHGSHVAGIIAADGGVDHLGIYGVAPEASLYIYKVCGKNGSCWADDIATAVTHAVDAGAHVLNLSLGADNSSTLIADAIAYAADKNVLVVAAAGNDGPYEDSIDYPAALETVVAVGALDETATIATWSSRGINESTTQGIIEERDIELAAPGVNVESTYYTGGYAILSGTSMASPHIAGLAAKLWQGDAVATRDLLRSLTLPVDLGESGDDNAYGWGLPQL